MFMTHPLHEKTKVVVKEYLGKESELLSLLQEIETGRVHWLLGYGSMFDYCTKGLSLAENQAYMLIGVSRKCREVPALKAAIEAGVLSANTAKKIVSVLKPSNADIWIGKAQELTQKDLEKEVAKENPERAIRATLKPVTETLIEFRCGISVEDEKLLRRCMEVIAQKDREAVLWPAVIRRLAETFLKHEDPIQKAERSVKRKEQVLRQVRTSMPQSLKHQVALRDKGACQKLLPDGTRCGSRYWIEIHHIQPRSLGGKHALENLITLCSAHHGAIHRHGQAGSAWHTNPKPRSALREQTKASLARSL